MVNLLKMVFPGLLMYNQGNMRLHVYLFIKYVSNNVYSDNNHGQPQSLYWIYSLLFLVAYTLWQPFVAYFRSDIDIIVCFFLGGMKMSGSSRAQRWAEWEMGNTTKNTATFTDVNNVRINMFVVPDWYQEPTESNQTRHKEGKITICAQLLPSSWVYLELWCLATGMGIVVVSFLIEPRHLFLYCTLFWLFSVQEGFMCTCIWVVFKVKSWLLFFM